MDDHNTNNNNPSGGENDSSNLEAKQQVPDMSQSQPQPQAQTSTGLEGLMDDHNTDNNNNNNNPSGGENDSANLEATQQEPNPSQSQPQPQAQISSQSTSAPTPAVTEKKKRIRKPRASRGSSVQGNASPLDMEVAPAARREKPKLPDTVLLDKISAFVPDCSLFSQLLEFESSVDAILARKKIEITESLKNPLQAQKILRIYVYNTFEKPDAESTSWSLRITGTIRDRGVDGLVKPQSKCYPKFSSFLKKITVYLDQSLYPYPDNRVVLWESSRSPVLREGFELKRRGDKEFAAIIRLEMNHVPEKFKLSPALQEVLGIEVETLPRIMVALWQYVKVKKLQEHDDTSYIMCDPPLRKVFGAEKLKLSMVSEKIAPHLSPPGPISLAHMIKLSGASPAGKTCLDVLVDVPLSSEDDKPSFLANLEKNEEIDTYDHTISSAMEKIREHYRRRAFFLGFSESPAEFINYLTASQARDLKLAAAAATDDDADKERRAEFYDQPWTEDAVIGYLNRKAADGTDDATGNN